MPLVKATIKAGIKSAFTEVMNQEEGREDALDTLADKIAATVVDAIKSAQITYTAGLVAPAMGGPVTGIFNCTIS